MTTEPKKIRVILQRMHSDGKHPPQYVQVGNKHFLPGVTANDVCEKINEENSKPNSMGLWLLQMHVDDPENYDASELEGGCKTIKDSSYVLEPGKQYFAVHVSSIASVIR